MPFFLYPLSGFWYPRSHFLYPRSGFEGPENIHQRHPVGNQALRNPEKSRAGKGGGFTPGALGVTSMVSFFVEHNVRKQRFDNLGMA